MAGTPTPVLTQQDFNLIPLLNVVAEPIAGSAVPSSTNVGRFYRNTTTGNFEYVLNSSTVVHLTASGTIVDADIEPSAAIAISKLAVNPLDRANHIGTQLADTVSDFDSQVNTHHPNDLALMTTDLNFNGHKGADAADPTIATDLATMQWVQNAISAAISGHDWKDSVRVATGGKSSQGNVTIASPGANIDGVALSAGDRVLLAAQTTASQNGIYDYNGSAMAMTRSADANDAGEISYGTSVAVVAGSNSDSIAMVSTQDPITLGTTALSFIFMANGTTYVQGTGITITGATIALSVPVSIANGGTGSTTAAAARTALDVPQRGFAGDVGTLTAGVGTDVVHNLGTLDVVAQVYRKSDGATVSIGVTRKDVNTVTITSSVAVTSGTLRVVVTPIS